MSEADNTVTDATAARANSGKKNANLLSEAGLEVRSEATVQPDCPREKRNCDQEQYPKIAHGLRS